MLSNRSPIERFLDRVITVKLSKEKTSLSDKIAKISDDNEHQINKNEAYYTLIDYLNTFDEELLDFLGSSSENINRSDEKKFRIYQIFVKSIHDAIKFSVDEKGRIDIDNFDFSKAESYLKKNSQEEQPEEQPLKNEIEPGWIEPLKIEFKDKTHRNGKTPEEQAEIFIERVLDLVRNHSITKVGITYSANEVDIHGNNQAEVMYHLQQLLKNKYSYLHSVVDFIPITTYADGKTKDPTKPNWLKNDIRNAKNFVKQGGVLLGWQNQYTPQGEFAIGGGVAARSFIGQLKNYVQSKLKKLADKYAPPPERQKQVGTINQSNYVEKIEIERKSVNDIALLKALFQTLKNPKALLAWPLQITGIDMHDISNNLISKNLRLELYSAVTKPQKEALIVDWINHLDIENNKKELKEKFAFNKVIDDEKNSLSKDLQKLFQHHQNSNVKKNSLVNDLEVGSLKNNYISMLRKYTYDRRNIVSPDPLFEARKQGAHGLLRALESCQTKKQLQEVIEGSQYFHQTLRGSRSKLIPILKSLQYEMKPYSKEISGKQKPLEKSELPDLVLQQPFSKQSDRKTSHLLINEILVEIIKNDATSEKIIRVLNVFSQSFNHVGGRLKKAVNGSLQEMRTKYPHSPISSPLRNFTQIHALQFMKYVIDHENKKLFFSQKDKDEKRHLDYAGKLVKKLLLCETRKDLESIRDEAIGMQATLKAYENKHSTLITMLGDIPHLINDFIKNNDLPSKKDAVRVRDFTGSDIHLEKSDSLDKKLPDTKLGMILSKLELNDSEYKETRKCALIQLLCHSKNSRDREFGQELLLKITPDYIEENKFNNPDCYYAQICMIKLALLGVYNLKNVNIENSLKELKQHLIPNAKPKGSLRETLNRVKEVMKTNLPQDFSFFQSHDEKTINKGIDFLNEITPVINNYSEMIKMQRVIDEAIKNGEINRKQKLHKNFENIKNENYYPLYDAVFYFKEHEKEALTWTDLKNREPEVQAVAYKTLLEFLYYATFGVVNEDTFKPKALALLSILKESVPEKIEGCEVKSRLNYIYETAYAMQNADNKKLIQKHIAKINTGFDTIKNFDKKTMKDFVPDLKKNKRNEFKEVFINILTDPDKLADAIHRRESIDSRNKINANDLEAIKLAVNNNDTSEYTLHDPKRLGAEMRSAGFLLDELKGLTPYQKLIYDAAINTAIADLTENTPDNNMTDIKEQYADVQMKGNTSETIARYHRDEKRFKNELMRLAEPLIREHIKDPNAFAKFLEDQAKTKRIATFNK